MKHISLLFFFASLFLQCSNTQVPPQTAAFDGKSLLHSLMQIQAGDPAFTEPYRQLILDADQCLNEGPYTVTSKTKTPPSGNKHDYMSMGPYWWPNPDTPDGLPYIRKDGQRNPERNQFEDRGNLGKLGFAVETLGLAYYFTKDEKYAAHAAKLIQVWFLNKETLMNPHLNYGQGIPGITDGRAAGLIETVTFIGLLEGVRLLEGSKSWTVQDNDALKQWFADFFEWFQTSRIGIDERKAHNNHGTWYDAQSIAMALYLDKNDVAAQIASEQSVARLKSQIMPDGSQPRELGRADGWGYSTMNLRGFFTLSTLAGHVDVDLWNVTNDDGKPYLKIALDFLIPTFEDSTQWKYSQTSNRFDRSTMFNLLLRASVVYNDPDYAALAQKYPSAERPGSRNKLLWSLVY